MDSTYIIYYYIMLDRDNAYFTYTRYLIWLQAFFFFFRILSILNTHGRGEKIF